MRVYKTSDQDLKIFKNNSGTNIAGSPPYMAPESFDGITSVKSDIYSFGIVLFQMVNKGKLPFKAELGEWEDLHKNEDMPILKSKLFPIIKKCLEKEPENSKISSRKSI